jgi:dUTP pyrophosphatase
MINHQVKGEMYFVDRTTHHCEPSAYMMYPRSSISKTELMLSNHTGIIDSGYRGFLMGAFRWLKPENASHDDYSIDRYTRLLQICLPTLHPIFVVLVDESELTDSTRGAGGFGSTGL